MPVNEEILITIKSKSSEAEKGLDNIKKKTKETKNEAKDLATEFSVMGVSISSLKGAFTKVKGVAKGMFTSIKMGIASTGIGLLVLAVGTLVTYFTQTKKGAELLQVAFKGVGAAIAVITDRISAIGGAIVKVFKGDFKGAVEDAKGAVSGLGAEIVKETKQMVELTKASQSLRDSQRDLNVETARRRAELESLKLIAEDTTKTEAERLSAAEAAMQLETELLDKRVANATEALRLKKAEVDASESTAEDLDELAQLEIDLFNIRQESTTKQIELNNKINSIRKEGQAAREQEEKDRQAAEDERAAAEEEKLLNRHALEQELALLKAESEEERELLRLEQEAEKLLKETEDAEARALIHEQLQIKKANVEKKYTEQAKKDSDDLKNKRIADEQAVAGARKQFTMDTLGMIQNVFGKESKAGKAAAIAQATINTYEGVTKALAAAPPPANLVLAGLTTAAGFQAIGQITSTKEPQFARGGTVRGFGTGTSDSIKARLSKGETVINARSTRMFKPLLSAINEAGGGVGFANGGTLDTGTGGETFGAVKAFVVTDEITDSQNSLQKIRQKATI